MADLEFSHEELERETSEENREPADTCLDVFTAAPSGGEEARCTPSCWELMDEKMLPTEEKLRCLLSKADELQTLLMYSQDQLQIEGFARVLPAILHNSRPFFTYLESTARSSSPGQTPPPLYMRTRLLQFTQQLCGRLEQLLLMYASFGYISLEEADPLSFSHFYIGQCLVNNIRLSIFRYCVPSPFLASNDNGLYKRMRWNVERERDAESGGEKGEEKERGLEQEKVERKAGSVEGEQDSSTEFYFLCCEDVPVLQGEGEAVRETRAEDRAVVRMWSIGQWVQTYPDPHNEDIYDWILCTVPQGQYRLLMYLGEEEPSSCKATDCLVGLLLTQAGPGPDNSTNAATQNSS